MVMKEAEGCKQRPKTKRNTKSRVFVDHAPARISDNLVVNPQILFTYMEFQPRMETLLRLQGR